MTPDQAEQQIRAQTKALRQYAGTDFHRELVLLLQALRESYMHDLLVVQNGTPRMSTLQGAAQQVAALEAAINGQLDSSPRL